MSGPLSDALVRALPWSQVRRAAICLGKTRFHKRATAERAAQHASKMCGFKLNVYLCDCCSGYHMTKKPLEK
jgi:hypothetical protein